jgi:putative cardiolipin synthase
MGLVIDSAAFARELRQVFEDAPDHFAYRVRIAPDGERLQWLDSGASGEVVVHDVDPETTVWQRLQVGILSGLPIDWLL